MESQEYMNQLLENARNAQKEYASYTQEQVDMVVYTIAKTVFDNAELLAKMAVNETGMGVYEHKVKKNKGKARILWNELKGKKSIGILSRDEKTGITEVAKPMGVVGAITPTTNPIVTPMCNAMFALKGKNAIIICPHPRSKKCSTKTVELINENLDKLHAPKNLIQIIIAPSVELSGMVMKSCDVCISTGGMAMVKAAYSSGKPAFGVGAGNVQCLIDEDVDIDKAVPMIVDGREFDNGIICSGEQTAIIPASNYEKVISKFLKCGAYYVEQTDEINRLREVLFPNGIMNKDLVGQSAKSVAAVAGIIVPVNTRILLVKTPAWGGNDLFSKEKMCPVITAYSYQTWSEAVSIAFANLNVEGKGHSVCIHSYNREHIEYAAGILPVSRFLLNQSCSTNNGGSFMNSLSATTTLGCGSWGNNSISENLSWKHLFNISRIADITPGSTIPSDEEIWR